MANTICPKCGIILLPKEVGDLVFIECSICRFKREYKDWAEHTCQECGHNKAIIVVDIMVRGDEGMTTIFRCLHCGATEKEGYKGY